MQVASNMAMELAEKGEQLSLMRLIELWHPVQDFAETVYFLGSPRPFSPHNSKSGGK